MRKRIHDLTLRWVNRERSRRGAPKLDELLTGQPHPALDHAGSDNCGLAHSLGALARVGNTHFRYGTERPRRLPLYARLFVRWFDAGKYPHLYAPQRRPLRVIMMHGRRFGKTAAMNRERELIR